MKHATELGTDFLRDLKWERGWASTWDRSGQRRRRMGTCRRSRQHRRSLAGRASPPARHHLRRSSCQGRSGMEREALVHRRNRSLEDTVRLRRESHVAGRWNWRVAKQRGEYRVRIMMLTPRAVLFGILVEKGVFITLSLATRECGVSSGARVMRRVSCQFSKAE
jgi:hypothetical protein